MINKNIKKSDLNKNYKIKDERNYGIDLLRVISMIFVLILHCLGHGGILYNTELNSPQYKFVWFIEYVHIVRLTYLH